jgi:hypothetical protein
MRAHHLALLPLASCAFAGFFGNGPVYNVPPDQSQIEEAVEAAVNIRDVPNNLDYRCGPKIGKCPIDTCCSSAGMYQELCRFVGSLMVGIQDSVARLSRTVVLQTARSTTAAVTPTSRRTDLPPKTSCDLTLARSHMAQRRFAPALSPEPSR